MPPQNILISLRCAPLHQDILHRWLDKRQYSIYTEKGKRATDQPLSAQSHFSAVDCFYRDFFAEPNKIYIQCSACRSINELTGIFKSEHKKCFPIIFNKLILGNIKL